MLHSFATSSLVRNNDQTSYAVLRSIASGCAKNIQMLTDEQYGGNLYRITTAKRARIQRSGWRPGRFGCGQRKGESGLSIEDTAEVLGISPASVKRYWTAARAWLYHEMTGGASA